MRFTLGKIAALIIVQALLVPSLSWGAMRLKYEASVYSDGEGIGMNRPEGIACSGNSFVVADSGNSRLLRYSYENQTVSAVATIQASGLAYPIRAQISSKGDIYVLDGKKLQIARLGADGAFKGFLDFSGVPAPGKVVPRSFKIGPEGDLLYVLDVFGGRVLVVDGEGVYQRHIPFPPEYGFFSDLAVNHVGGVLLLDSVKGVVYSTSGEAGGFAPLAENLKERVRFPANIAIHKRGTIFIVDQHGGTILLMGQDGSIQGEYLGPGWKESLLNYPAQICFDGNDNLFIADRNNSRVQILEIAQ